MPGIVPPGSKVLVSGANGYIAAWVVRTLLEKGYAVRGTVRSEEKGTHLKKIFAGYGEKFETVVVEDITKEGAFDEAVKGVHAIEHTASPFHFKADDPQELIGPALNGTRSILKSALNESSIRRIVVTSSSAAILSILPERKVFTELDWNEQSIEEVKQGKNASQVSKYRASKTLAEKAAWDFYEASNTNRSWDLVVLNPPFVFGPIIHDVSSPAALGTSAGDWYNSVVRPDMGGKTIEAITTIGGGWVDVRDIALAHVLALQKQEAGGERLLISKGEFVYQDFIDTANALSPSPIPSHTDLPKGKPGAGKDFVAKIVYDASKASKILGPELVYHTMEETTRDTLADFEKRGW
ncbi:D-lactaldehyde dehydrogenase [Lentinula aff. detonsa]|uniref:D-lactaldehyde dehydrogenase n=1 Tax=Lentinula aff. detonsa TaxID=2804958 RepID=A0AA38KFK3_9AGAR|nr:D-lactaldehyde dehydrogenase [Lentinula aff. detonsa]KAJ3792898.1 D-lactaldehyde dehydrogenase [Lentinula aff. detonsa]